MTGQAKPNSISNILVVDDDPTSRLILKQILRKEGFLVITAENGRQARTLAEREQPDLIIMDIMMPEEDGLTACTTLKTNARTTNIPVIFISSAEDLKSKIDGFNAGGQDYITKPYQHQEVIARVRLHIRMYHTYTSMVAASLEQLKQLSQSQKNILVQPQDFPEANFSVFYLPAQAAGGDFYDVIHSGADIYDYLVADISGHSASTALPSAALKALVRQNVSMLYAPLENLNLVNQHLRPVLQEDQYATLIYARLNKSRMLLTLVNAGHPPAILQHANGKAQIVPQNGDGLGLYESVVLDVCEIPITQGSRIYLYSDGLIERDQNGPIPRRVGLENLLRLIEANAAQPLEALLQTIQNALFPGTNTLDDDAVLLGFEVL